MIEKKVFKIITTHLLKTLKKIFLRILKSEKNKKNQITTKIKKKSTSTKKKQKFIENIYQ